MPIYQYKAVDSKGKKTQGVLEAMSESDVSTQLAKLGLTPINISFKVDKGAGKKKGPVKGKANDQAVIVFTRQFATIIKAAVPIVEGLGVLAEQTEDEPLQHALRQVIHDIEEGLKLSEAMAKHPNVFSDLYVSTVLAGEAGGVLDKVLLRLSSVLEEERMTRDSIGEALRYPIMVVGALFVALIVLSVFVMPQFAKIYAGMGIALPLPTQVMILISKALQKYWFISFPALAGGFFALKFAVSTPVGRRILDTIKFKAPVFGKVYVKIVMLRFASMVSVLYQAGLPILKILDIVKVTVGNVVLAKEIDGIKKDVADGKGISAAIIASKLFPRLVGYMIAIGEKAGALSGMLDSLCDYYSQEVRVAMKGLTGLIEPIMTAFLGSAVMGMAFAIFLPMWSLMGAMKASG
jgi:type II secretory pathway component PulF